MKIPTSSDIQIDWSIEGSLPPICVDRIQTQQVFINLISNAIEAIDGSANTAKILLRAFVTQEDEVIVQVIDNGPGLEDTDLRPCIGIKSISHSAALPHSSMAAQFLAETCNSDCPSNLIR